MRKPEAGSDYALIRALPFPAGRAPQRQGPIKLPPGTTVTSADGHFSIAHDLWFERFPPRLRDRAPRVWRENGVCHIGFNGKSLRKGMAWDRWLR
jgi:hypothetical protein